MALQNVVVQQASAENTSVIQISINDTSVVEGNNGVSPMRFSKAVVKPVTINYLFQDGSVQVDNDEVVSFNNQEAQAAVETVKLIPNPSQGRFNVILNGYSGRVLVQITDGEARTIRYYVLQTATNNTTSQYIDLSECSPGIYHVIITDEKGNHITERMMTVKDNFK